MARPVNDPQAVPGGDESGDGSEVSSAEAGRGRRSATRRRRANAEGGRRNRFEVKVDDAEVVALRELADSQRVTIPRLLVESTLAGGGSEAADRRVALEELFALHRLLGSIANNVNQIARATNATLETQPESAAALLAVRRSAERIDAAVDALSFG